MPTLNFNINFSELHIHVHIHQDDGDLAQKIEDISAKVQTISSDLGAHIPKSK